MQSSSHCEIRTSTAMAPAEARRTKSPAITSTSTSSIALRPSEYAPWSAMKDQARERGRPERCRQPESGRRERGCQRERSIRGELAARHGPKALDRVEPVGVGVADVVDEVRSARRRAVRDEGGDRRDPAARIAELSGEDDPREQEEVLRPLARAQRDEHRDERCTPRR